MFLLGSIIIFNEVEKREPNPTLWPTNIPSTPLSQIPTNLSERIEPALSQIPMLGRRRAWHDRRTWLLGVDSNTTLNFPHANQELRHKSSFGVGRVGSHSSHACWCLSPTGPNVWRSYSFQWEATCASKVQNLLVMVYGDAHCLLASSCSYCL